MYLMKMPQLTTYEATEISGKTNKVHCIMATGAVNEAQLGSGLQPVYKLCHYWKKHRRYAYVFRRECAEKIFICNKYTLNIINEINIKFPNNISISRNYIGYGLVIDKKGHAFLLYSGSSPNYFQYLFSVDLITGNIVLMNNAEINKCFTNNKTYGIGYNKKDDTIWFDINISVFFPV